MYGTIFTVEDGTIIGGFGSAIQNFVLSNQYKTSVIIVGIPDNFVEHGTIDELQKICGIDVEGLMERFKNLEI